MRRAGLEIFIGWRGQEVCLQKKNELQQNGDLAGLDFVVNTVAKRITS